jgi:prolyl-tRNA editing enzyme YbaK/EbsC (Cys-tRNA(Pro) deacylase)
MAPAAPVSEGYARVAAYLAERGHPQALGVAVGQIAKSVVFRRVADGRAVLVMASGDRRVDEAKVSALAGAPCADVAAT